MRRGAVPERKDRAMRWLRLYDTVVDDPKVQHLSPEMFKHWINILCISSQNSGKLPARDAVAFKLRVTEKKAEKILNDLFGNGLLDRADGVFSPHNWAKLQFVSDCSTERVKRFRQRSKNVSETLDETAPESESESEKKENLVPSPAAEGTTVNPDSKTRKRFDYPADFSQFWLAYPVDANMSKAEAHTEWKKLSADDRQTAIKSIPAFKDWLSKKAPKDYRTIHACRYLKYRRFEGHNESAEKTATRVFYPIESDNYKAWDAHFRDVLHRGGAPENDYKIDGRYQRGWTFETPWPPGYSAAPAEIEIGAEQ